MLFPSGLRLINRFHNSLAKRFGRLFTRRQNFSGEQCHTCIASRAASVALVLCLLVSSTPAAPQTIAAFATEAQVSFTLWLHSSGLATRVPSAIRNRNVVT